MGKVGEEKTRGGRRDKYRRVEKEEWQRTRGEGRVE